MSPRRHLVTAGLALAAGIATAAAVAQAQQALREGEGVWVKGPVSGASPSCTQVWTCSPTEPVGITDQETLAFSSDQTAEGKCLRHGSDSSCRVCEAPPPAVSCKWQVFEKAP